MPKIREEIKCHNFVATGLIFDRGRETRDSFTTDSSFRLCNEAAITKTIDYSVFTIRKSAIRVSLDSEIPQLLFCSDGPFLVFILGFQDLLKHSKLFV